MIFITAGVIFREEFWSLFHSTFATEKFLGSANPSKLFLSREDPHLIHLLEQIVIDLLAHNRIKLVSRMRSDEVPDPRRRGLELPGGAFADEIEVFKETASLAVVYV